MKSFYEFIFESTARNVYLLLKSEFKKKFKSDKNLTLDQKGNEYHFTSDVGNFTIVPSGRSYKLGKYNFEGHDKWFLSTIKNILKFETIRTKEE